MISSVGYGVILLRHLRLWSLLTHHHLVIPRPTRESIPLQQCCQRHTRRGCWAQHDDRSTHRAGYLLQTVQGNCRMEVRQGIRERREIQRGQVYPRRGASMRGVLDVIYETSRHRWHRFEILIFGVLFYSFSGLHSLGIYFSRRFCRLICFCFQLWFSRKALIGAFDMNRLFGLDRNGFLLWTWSGVRITS